MLLLRTLLISATLTGLSLVTGAQPVSLTRSEISWAFFHPFAAVKLKRISRQISCIYEGNKHRPPLDGLDNGGLSDAYRHSFYMAGFAQRINPRKLRRLGRAHEKANYRSFKKHRREEGEMADSLSGVMDLWNNELGFRIGRANPELSLRELSTRVIDAIMNGEARIMRRNEQGSYLDCKGLPLDLQEYAGQWHVPKCIVPSKPLTRPAADRK